MEDFYFEQFKVVDKRIRLDENNIDGYNLLEFLFLSTTTKRIARIFNDLLDENVIKIDENYEYEVEAILDDADDNGDKQYLIKWKDWHVEFSTWEPLSNLTNCKQQFLLYEKRKTDQSQIIDQYVQPKLELIRQVMAIITECRVEYKHVQKYLPQAVPKRALKRPGSDLFLGVKKRPRNVTITLKANLEEWQTFINKTYPLFDVKVENMQDREGPPLDYEFITDYVSSTVEIHQDPPFGCQCGTTCISNKDCVTIHHGSTLPYTSTGKIRVPVGVPVFECNKACSCNMSCPYRVVQRGVRLDLTIFRTSNRGWGLKTRNAIKKGNFMLEYLGEILTADEAEIRGTLYDQQNLTYLFDLDFAGDPEFTVDAYKKGNLAHFINHSCSPNMTSRCVYINCLDIRLPRIAFFAARDIRAGEELSFDYMMTGAITNDIEHIKYNEESFSSISVDDSAVKSSTTSDIVSISMSSTNVSPKDEAGSETASVNNSVQVPVLIDLTFYYNSSHVLPF